MFRTCSKQSAKMQTMSLLKHLKCNKSNVYCLNDKINAMKACYLTNKTNISFEKCLIRKR